MRQLLGVAALVLVAYVYAHNPNAAAITAVAFLMGYASRAINK